MRALSTIKVVGPDKAVEDILAKFGDVEVGFEDSADVGFDYELFELKQILPNFYGSSNADKDGASLYVLVPAVVIEKVWVRIKEYEDVRYGKAEKAGKEITPAVAILQGNTCLYVCLQQIDTELEVGFLGI